MKQEAFISYAWPSSKKAGKESDHPVVKNIHDALKPTFNVVTDRKYLGYKGSIKDFENRLARGNKIVLVVCDKYLRSKHCMYEILKIKENDNVKDRIFPVVLKNAKIHDSNGTLKYIRYWEREIDKVSKKIKSLGNKSKIKSVREDLALYKRIRDVIDEVIYLLRDLNTLSPEIHEETDFSQLLKSMKLQFGEKLSPNEGFGKRLEETSSLYERAIKAVNDELTKAKATDSGILKRLKHWHEKSKSQQFQVAVMAMVKSGKSTFLNALLGEEFLPMNNVPETAVPVRITHSQFKAGKLSRTGGKDVIGSDKIKQHLEKVNNEFRDVGIETVPVYTLYGNIWALSDRGMRGVGFEILDTPGFGEALGAGKIGKTINETVDELLDQISVIIYILDYTKLKTAEEREVIEKLSSIRPDILSKIKERMFFIVNKIDAEDRNSLTQKETLDYVQALISTQLPDIRKEQIYLISASRALLSRLVLNGKSSEDQRRDFGQQAFGIRAHKMSETDYEDAAREILSESKIQTVEDRLIHYVYENRGQILLGTLLDNLKRLLDEFTNKYIKTATGSLRSTIAALDVLEKKFNDTKKKHAQIQEEADKFFTEIKDWINTEFRSFEGTTLFQIESIFSPETAQRKSGWQTWGLTSWISDIRERFQNVFRGISEVNKESLEERIILLNEQLSAELESRFNVFRTQLETRIFSKQIDLLSRLENSINAMTVEFEQSLGRNLNVSFVTTRLELGSHLNFADILKRANATIDRFINRKATLVEVRVSEQVYGRRTWCAQKKWYTANRKELRRVDYFSMSKADMEDHWKEQISTMNRNATVIANRFVEKEIKDQAKQAIKQFDDHVIEYLATIQSEKSRLTKGNPTEIAERMEALETLSAEINQVIAKAGLLSS